MTLLHWGFVGTVVLCVLLLVWKDSQLAVAERECLRAQAEAARWKSEYETTMGDLQAANLAAIALRQQLASVQEAAGQCEQAIATVLHEASVRADIVRRAQTVVRVTGEVVDDATRHEVVERLNRNLSE